MIVTAITITPEFQPPYLQVVDDIEPEVTAKAWGVIDVINDEMLFSENATTTYPIASVTKLVTAATLREKFDDSTKTTISWADIATEGRAGSLVPGDDMTLHTLIFPLLLESSNDASEAIKNSLDEDQLVLAMNDYASGRDLQNTFFADPSGLSPENISTVRNLASLATDIYFEEPHLIDITSLPEYYYESYGWHNNSPFIDETEYIGGKHGYTPEAGKTAVVFFEERYPEGRAVVAYIILGSSDLKADVAALRAEVKDATIYQ